MLDNFNILILGGDTRYLEIIDQLAEKRAGVYLIGYDELSFDHANVKQLDKEATCENIDAIILPVSGTTKTGEVEAEYSKDSIALTEELVNSTPEHCVIYSGISTPYLEELSKKTDRELTCIFNRNDLAVLNSIPTSEGALQLAMEQTDYTIHGSHVHVIGFGRIGMTISRLFTNVGANVSVYARKAADLARITEMRMNPVRMNNLKKEIGQANIIINTVGAPVLTADNLSEVSKDSLIIDLASAPGGTDFDYAKESGIQAIHALGRPGKVAPKTAGNVMTQILVELISETDRLN